VQISVRQRALTQPPARHTPTCRPSRRVEVCSMAQINRILRDLGVSFKIYHRTWIRFQLPSQLAFAMQTVRLYCRASKFNGHDAVGQTRCAKY
jgi:hypothetical protein